MKIIFNSAINDWYWQIYDEIIRNNEVILPENYKDKSNRDTRVNLYALEKCIKENPNVDFIFDFRGEIPELIKWYKRKIDVPLIKFEINVSDRPYKGKMSVFTKIWYSERNAKLLMEKYNKDNLIYLGLAANPYIYHPTEIKKEYDISFFGQHYRERYYWIDVIKRFCVKNKIIHFFPVGHGIRLPWSFENINTLYNQTKINLTFAPLEPMGRIINLRTLEVSLSGNFQLMQYTPYIKEYFEIDNEIVCWKNKKDLFEKILYYLENEDEREKLLTLVIKELFKIILGLKDLTMCIQY